MLRRLVERTRNRIKKGKCHITLMWTNSLVTCLNAFDWKWAVVAERSGWWIDSTVAMHNFIRLEAIRFEIKATCQSLSVSLLHVRWWRGRWSFVPLRSSIVTTAPKPAKTTLAVDKVYFYAKNNATEHRTVRFELVHRQPETAILRRGQPFTFIIRFSDGKPFDPAKDILRLHFNLGGSNWFP